jgi:3-hydroxyisobutyrate dehydrogenase
LIRRIHAVCAERGVDVLDAPVSGGVPGARSGKLAVLVGGDEALYTRIKPVLDAIGDKVTWVGGIGCGTVAKLVHNMVSACSRMAIAEGMTLGMKAGVAPEVLLDALSKSSFGQGRVLKDMIPNTVFPGAFDDVNFALKLLRKDVGLATELGREYHVPMMIAALAEQQLEEALGRGWGDKDSMTFFRLQEERAGVEIRTKKRGG